MEQTGGMSYELRTYTATPGRIDSLLARFRDHTVALFQKHGMHSVGYWTSVEEPEKLVYILHHEGDPKQNWADFQADPAWKAAKEASVVNGEIVAHVDSAFLAPTDFSTLR
ncbi:MAG: family containing protein [Glaciihabitans sp.]|jgi:hypothetical protein|nr:family containing protein [Glaciihabitans sp.]